MNYWLKKAILPGIIFMLLDFIFISLNKINFESQIIRVQHFAVNLNIFGAIACYLFLIGGLYYFILRNHESVLDAFLLGLVIFGVFETTNYAMFKKWQLMTVFIDVLWGGIVFATTTYITYKFIDK
jgi:uncharacterized membrane protein